MTDEELYQVCERTAAAFRECGEAIVAECQRVRAVMLAGFTATPAQREAVKRLAADMKRRMADR